MNRFAYYNECDPFAAEWLRDLISKGHLPDGEVDDRRLETVTPADLTGFTQCHFFAGIGGWAYALTLAGWPADRPVWTGSCPCQPFSAAGKQRGHADDRHLWPIWHRLIRQCRPDRIFGEQVANAIGHGWLDLVSTDVEAEGYAIGAVVLGAHSVGAPHLRQRLWWVADRAPDRRRREECADGRREREGDGAQGRPAGSESGGDLAGVAHSECGSAERYRPPVGGASPGATGAGDQRERLRTDAEYGGDPHGLADDHRRGQSEFRGCGLSRDGDATRRDDVDRCGEVDLAYTTGPRRIESGRSSITPLPTEVTEESGRHSPSSDPAGGLVDVLLPRLEGHAGDGAGSLRHVGEVSQPNRSAGAPGVSHWSACDWLPCRDGKFRPVEPGTFPLAHGIPARVGRLRGYGNAIVPQVAAAFVAAYLDDGGPVTP